MLLFKNRNCKKYHIKRSYDKLSMCKIAETKSNSSIIAGYEPEYFDKTCQRCLRKYKQWKKDAM